MAISDEISRLQSAKNSIKIAIGLKGITIPDSVTLSHYDTYISQIKTQGQYEIKTITPNALGQVVMPSEGYDALSQVIINGDLNLTPQNIANGVTIFGVTGNLQTTSKLQHKSVTPNASGQMVTPDDGFDGLSSVSISGDSNLSSENIKKGVSIFGVAGEFVGSESDGGDSGFNVYAQSSEPSSKDGVWLKTGGASGSAKFYNFATATGEMLESEKFSFINTTGMSIFGQEMIDGELYMLTTNNTSKKINLKTKVISTINTPTFTTSGVAYIGTVYYKGRIYMFGGTTNTLYWKYYDLEKDITSAEFSTGYNSSGIGTTPTSDTKAGAYVFDGKAYVFMFARDNYIGGDHVFYAIFDLEKNTYLGNKKWSQNSVSRYSSISGYGQYVYFILADKSGYNNSYLKVFDLVNGTYASVCTFAGTKTKIPYARANEVYAFEGTSSAQTSYMVYELNSQTIKTVKTNNSYFVAQATTFKPMLLDDSTGILYFRTGTTSAMQFLPSPDIDKLPLGALAVIQSPNNNSVKIQDSSNLHIGIDNVYIKTSDGLETDAIFLGDGYKWSVWKNPKGETAVVTFDTDGGGTIDSQEIVLGQKIAAVEQPKKSGYVFLGWYKNGEPFDFNTPIVGDITLVAAYETPTFIEYIESSKAQYINTGVVPNSKTKVETKMAWTSGGGSQVNGWGSSGSVESFFWGVNSNNKFVVSVSSNYTAVETEASFDTKPHVFLLENGAQAFDGELIGADTIGDTAEAGQTMYLFGLHGEWQATGMTSACSTRMYYCKIYTEGELIRDYKPAIDSNGIACLYDAVECKYCYSIGNEAFLEPYSIDDFTKLSYIEGTGTQFIDTGIFPDNSTILQIDYNITATSFSGNNTLLFKAHGSATEPSFNMVCTGGGGTVSKARVTFGENYTYYVDFTGLNNNDRHTIEVNCPNSNVIVDNASTYTVKASTFACTKTLKLFGDTGTFIGKIYSCKIQDNTGLTKNLIPVKHKKNNIIGMYDLVNGLLLVNGGTGVFKAGAEV